MGWNFKQNFKIRQIPIIKPLTVIINRSLQTGVFPDCMKLAIVSSLHKGGREDYCTNYRPISLLPVISKILEKVVYSRTYGFLTARNQLFKSQYGFRKQHSCENAVQELLSNVLKGFECKEYTAAIFLDLSKAFDILKHSLLLTKMEIYGIRCIALSWFDSYLSNRSMNVKYSAGDPAEITVSDEHSVKFGVPQGGCLGPLLFLLYCNDLPLNLTLCSCILFVDDTTIYRSHKNLTYLRWCLQEDLSVIADWFKANKLMLNISKSVCILFDEKGHKIDFNLNINETELQTVEYTKFLGVWIDRKLK